MGGGRFYDQYALVPEVYVIRRQTRIVNNSTSVLSCGIEVIIGFINSCLLLGFLFRFFITCVLYLFTRSVNICLVTMDIFFHRNNKGIPSMFALFEPRVW